ncbi:hypothetical protein GCM10010365_68500 [Streptomyces poonensis]|uniref:Uncharacterized protein n=1 Tax=Streptomyces poonensis TaxID=68255 RepID=A0A918UW11_9ACTN|nr:hypothetical protein GCM10010365_68500 [Streptomyces poonensis]GLJ91090.1 hypothetical protein GCM10017589_36960 [Streptomyces poonensis]
MAVCQSLLQLSSCPAVRATAGGADAGREPAQPAPGSDTHHLEQLDAFKELSKQAETDGQLSKSHRLISRAPNALEQKAA